MPTLHGRGGMLYLAGTGVAVKVANARSWKFTIDKALDENNKLGDSWVTQLLGLMKYTGSMSGNLDTTDTTPWDAAVATAIKGWYFYPDLTATTRYYYGSAWVKLDVEDNLTSVIRYTADFDGDGQIASN